MVELIRLKMVFWKQFVSVLVLVCTHRIQCNVLWSSEKDSPNNGSEYTKRGVEYAENPRIDVIHGDRSINDTQATNERFGDIEIIVHAFNEGFLLSLKLNRHLFAASYVEKILRKSGAVRSPVNHTENNCYSIGRIENREDSVAAVSLCKGITGYFVIGDVSYHVESHSSHLNGSVEVYRFREDSQLVYGCGTQDNDFHNRFHPNSHERRHRRDFRWPQDGDGRDKVLELYIANDFAQYVNKGRDSAAVFQRAKDIANFASASYQPQGIYFVLVGMEVWADANKIVVNSSNVNETLDSWCDYRMRNITPLHYNDNAVLITATGFEKNIIGKAYIGNMCSNQYSGVVVADLRSSALAAGSTMAHEIGHSFGLQHDTDQCSCPDQDSKCIMYPSASAKPATNWSDCSVHQLRQGFKAGLDICLYDAPQVIYQPTVSTCGNGIVEADEQCDCGKTAQTVCNSSCCNSTTCRLIGPAACASGRCCDATRCRILDSGSLCRGSSSDDCDLPEHCDGVSSTCPSDTYKPDGTKCSVNGEFAYCYSGRCRSHRSQCELIWGKGTNNSNPLCYERSNPLGTHYGNCGLRWLPNVTYIPCQSKDVMCGKLLCDTSPSTNLVYYQNYFLLSTASINNVLTCNSVIFDYGLRIQDPGLVPNGASCGDGKMCINQTCVNVNVSQVSCSKSCGTDQTCNNLGNCQSQRSESLTSSPTHPSCRGEADVIFLVDASSSTTSTDFSTSLTYLSGNTGFLPSMDLRPSEPYHSQAGVVLNTDKGVVDVGLGNFTDADKMADHLLASTGTRYVSRPGDLVTAMRLAGDQFQQVNGGRSGVPHALFLIVSDVLMGNSNRTALVAMANTLFNEGVTIMAAVYGASQDENQVNSVVDAVVSYPPQENKFYFLDARMSSSKNGTDQRNRSMTQLCTEIPVCASFADVVFLMDSSGNVWPDDWINMMSFVRNTLRHMYVSQNGARFALVKFGGNQELVFNLTSHKYRSQVLRAIENIRFYPQPQVDISSAIEFASTKIFSVSGDWRPSATKILILLSTGFSNLNSDRTDQAALDLKSKGVLVYSIGLGLDNAALDEKLAKLASNKTSDFHFNVTSFDDSQLIDNAIVRRTCRFNQK